LHRKNICFAEHRWRADNISFAVHKPIAKETKIKPTTSPQPMTAMFYQHSLTYGDLKY